MIFPKPPKKEKKKQKPLKRSWIKKTRKGPRRTARVKNRALLDEIKKQSCCACGYPPGNPKNPIDPSHLISVGAGGDDSESNVCPMDRRCHQLWHSLGIVRFSKRFPGFIYWLKEHKRFDLLDKISYHDQNHEGINGE